MGLIFIYHQRIPSKVEIDFKLRLVRVYLFKREDDWNRYFNRSNYI